MGLLLDRLKQIELSTSNRNDLDQPIEYNHDDLDFEKSSHSKEFHSSASISSNVSKSNGVIYKAGVKFPDLESIPPELSLQILKYLNATDLCLAACVWSSLANDDALWQSLCKTTWGYASCYNSKNCFRKIFMQLDEATLTFNADWKKVKFFV